MKVETIIHENHNGNDRRLTIVVGGDDDYWVVVLVVTKKLRFQLSEEGDHTRRDRRSCKGTIV